MTLPKMSDKVPNIGRLSKGATRGKLIVEWPLGADTRSFNKEPGADAPEFKSGTVKVYLEGLKLRAECPLLAKPVVGTNIEELFHEVQELVREQLTLRTALTWERWLQVEVKDVYSRSDTEVGTQVSYAPIWRAVASDGKIYTVHNSNNLVLELGPELAPGREVPDGGSLEFRLANDNLVTSRTYVPATEQNIAAVKLIQGRLQALTGALGALLRPGETQQALDSVPADLATAPTLLPWAKE